MGPEALVVVPEGAGAGRFRENASSCIPFHLTVG